MKFTKSLAAARQLENLIPGGAHTYARGADQYPESMPVVIRRGKGCEVWDVDGNRYIEFNMGLRSVILGHGYPAVVEAAEAAMKSGCSFVRPSVFELECAEKMLEVVPSMDMVKFAKNGSDVTTAAVKLARAATGRDCVAICRDQPFFSTDDWFIGTTAMNAGIPDCVRELTLSFPYGDIAALEALLEDAGNTIACVILEPEKYENSPVGYLQDVRDLCDRFGICMILDEMITGFRHHMGGVHLREGVTPDLVSFGKGIANGFANSALMGRREYMRLGGFDHDDPRVFLLSTTHGAETSALAATTATMQVLSTQPVLESMNEMGKRLMRGVETVTMDLGIDKFFQVAGSPSNLIYVTRDQTGEPSQEFRTLFLQETMTRGLLAPSFVISYSHTAAIIDETIEALRGALRIYAKALEDGVKAHLRSRPVRPPFRRFG